MSFLLQQQPLFPQPLFSRVLSSVLMMRCWFGRCWYCSCPCPCCCCCGCCCCCYRCCWRQSSEELIIYRILLHLAASDSKPQTDADVSTDNGCCWCWCNCKSCCRHWHRHTSLLLPTASSSVTSQFMVSTSCVINAPRAPPPQPFHRSTPLYPTQPSRCSVATPCPLSSCSAPPYPTCLDAPAAPIRRPSWNPSSPTVARLFRMHD